MGFRLGSYEEGDFEVVSASTCHHIPQRAKELVRVRRCGHWMGCFFLGGGVCGLRHCLFSL